MAIQLDLFDAPPTTPLAKPVNVASVPKRSPFRYPGGKTWLIPRIRQWLSAQAHRPTMLYEPFTGGGIVGLTAAFERLADHVTLIELDEQVAAVWHTLINDADGAEWLAERMLTFTVTEESVLAVLAAPAHDLRTRAFQTIVKNRMYHGGILAPGSALIRHGENGKGLTSRWYPTTLAARMRAIASVRARLTFIHGDALTTLDTHATEKHAVWFIDPPYTASKKKAGSRLYTHAQLDHARLFDATAQLSGDFLMTYDEAEEIRTLAETHAFAVQPIAMNNTHHATMNELLIGRSLAWAC